MNRRKELKEQYKLMKPDMGLFIIRSKLNNKCYIEAALNLNSRMNREIFQLGAQSHPNRELQKDWKDFGKQSFIVEILEKIEYKQDELEDDYTEELQLLKIIWEEKLGKEGLVFYMK